jgi:hypothetical protein
MAHTTEALPGEPIIVTTYFEPYDPVSDVVEANHEAAELLGDHPFVYYINDISQVEFSFSKVIHTMASAFRDRSKLEASRIRGIAVGTGKMLKIFIDGAKQFQYGEINIELCESVEEAVDFARSQLDGK